MISFTVFFPDPSCSLFYKRDRARPKRGALVQKGKGRRDGGAYVQRMGACTKRNWFGKGLTLQYVEGGLGGI